MILAYAALTAQIVNVGYQDVSYSPGVRVPIVLERSAAARAGILPGDLILALDDDIIQGPDSVKTVVANIKRHRDLSIDFTGALCCFIQLLFGDFISLARDIAF